MLHAVASEVLYDNFFKTVLIFFPKTGFWIILLHGHNAYWKDFSSRTVT